MSGAMVRESTDTPPLKRVVMLPIKANDQDSPCNRTVQTSVLGDTTDQPRRAAVALSHGRQAAPPPEAAAMASRRQKAAHHLVGMSTHAVPMVMLL
eukprot:CAMPEP_0171102636 /NCGR_PEP_ID=MMETSP0766_2-20121228/58360_1 /TAXON_ID=439317 /ORGANISM="Gambierdiscus australes, Strain CAWD 149" /LENGTH=95 /DNA_ID=CAMNT_0011562963 /DNA_START=10 /DNA_END=294 /DNA_ORIENTATION=-